LPDGCRFHPRCPHSVAACETGDHPPTYDTPTGSGAVSCVFYDGERDPETLDEGTSNPVTDGGGETDA
ncbi:MAG: ABC transporter ATP-binding protein, partial [Halobaculum sp.]